MVGTGGVEADRLQAAAGKVEKPEAWVRPDRPFSELLVQLQDPDQGDAAWPIDWAPAGIELLEGKLSPRSGGKAPREAASKRSPSCLATICRRAVISSSMAAEGPPR